jgi:hypothetical protein
MIVRRIRVLALVASCAFAPLAAQRSSRSTACAPPDTTKEWFRMQRAWLDDSKHDWSDDALRQQLVRAAGLDLSHPLPVQLGWSATDDWSVADYRHGAGPDSTATALLKSRLQTRGSPWPTRSAVGAAGVHAVWVITMRDTSLHAPVLRRIMEAGLGESFESEVAVLEDRVRTRAGRGQLYGTLFKADGTPAGHIEDSSHVDLRRDAAWLPPLARSACAMQRARGAK